MFSFVLFFLSLAAWLSQSTLLEEFCFQFVSFLVFSQTAEGKKKRRKFAAVNSKKKDCVCLVICCCCC